MSPYSHLFNPPPPLRHAQVLLGEEDQGREQQVDQRHGGDPVPETEGRQPGGGDAEPERYDEHDEEQHVLHDPQRTSALG